MKKMIEKVKISAILLMVATLSFGCAATNATTIDSSERAEAPILGSGTAASENMADNPVALDITQASGLVEPVALMAADIITDNVKEKDIDSTWNTSESTQIALNGMTASITGDGASFSGGTVTISKAGTYVISGTLTKGQILVDAAKEDDVRIVLNGTNITADKNAALYAAVADKVVIILAEGTQNTLTDGVSYTYADAEKEEPNAALFSKCDLSINGTGTLTVNGNYQHGIATKDDLVIAGGGITVNAVGTAIRGKDTVTILDGGFRLTSTVGDGIKTANDTDADKGWIWVRSGTFQITANNDGIQAASQLRIDDGEIEIVTGGGWPGGSIKRGSHARTNEGVVQATLPDTESYKGVKSGGDLVINGGTFTISSYDGAVHSNSNIVINGGVVTAQTGEDGVHADNAVTVNGGKITIQNSYEGIEGASIDITGGTINVRSTDDGMNVTRSTGILTITGGEIYVNAGGDGLDSNGSFVLAGGAVYVDGPTSSDDGSIDVQSRFTFSGGTLVAASLRGGDMPGTAAEQPVIGLSYTAAQKAGTEITLKAADGTTIASHTPQKDYSSVIISAPDLALNETYTFYADGTKLSDVTLTTDITRIDSTGAAVSGGMGDMGGGGKGGGGFDPANRPDGMTPPERPADGMSPPEPPAGEI